MYFSNSGKYPKPDEISKEYGVKFFVHHIHVGNDPDGTTRMMFNKHGPIPLYVTICKIKKQIRDENDPRKVLSEEVLGYGESVCNPKDSPNRRLGHEIAVSRAIKDFVWKLAKTNQQQPT